MEKQETPMELLTSVFNGLSDADKQTFMASVNGAENGYYSAMKRIEAEKDAIRRNEAAIAASAERARKKFPNT